jgi:hypothetical protein
MAGWGTRRSDICQIALTSTAVGLPVAPRLSGLAVRPVRCLNFFTMLLFFSTSAGGRLGLDGEWWAVGVPWPVSGPFLRNCLVNYYLYNNII